MTPAGSPHRHLPPDNDRTTTTVMAMAVASTTSTSPSPSPSTPPPSSPPSSPPTTHAIIQAWVAQLLDPDIQNLVEASNGQIEIHLFANSGKVRKRPIVTLNAGPQPMEHPG